MDNGWGKGREGGRAVGNCSNANGFESKDVSHEAAVLTLATDRLTACPPARIAVRCGLCSYGQYCPLSGSAPDSHICNSPKFLLEVPNES
jgi:hypothetical protein